MVSCIIPTYKQMKYLYEAIDSVLSQNYPIIELIITDDASPNFEYDKISSYIENNKGPNLKNYTILHHANNLGTVRNMNEALKIAKGQIVLPLAADDHLYSTSVISKIVDEFKLSGCDILVCSRMRCSADMAKEIRLMPHPKYINFIQRKMGTAEGQYKQMALGNTMEFASGAAMYYKRDCIAKLGYYDEKYTLWEDGPFVAKATRLGITIRTAYGIISTAYREGGISTKKTRINPIIAKDYCNIIEYEYISYKDRFSTIEYWIIRNRWVYQRLFDESKLMKLIKCPVGFMNEMRIKALRVILRGIPL